MSARGGRPDRTDGHDERGSTMTGVDPDRLDDQQLMKELEAIHRTRHDTLLHGCRVRPGRGVVRRGQLSANFCAAEPLQSQMRRRVPLAVAPSGESRQRPDCGLSSEPSVCCCQT